jgi:16S rRNA (cytosine967-C5)-methyltransferase
VQDAGSQLVALALAAAPLDGPDRSWLDLCAGPGGKAALLGALAGQRGAHVLANERQPHRSALVRSTVRALPPGSVSVITGDGTVPAWRSGGFDRVLLDVPCSGLGALRRRPEARWRRRPEDIADLVPLQRALLDQALAATRSGGIVAYATCSPVVAETADIVRPVLENRLADGRSVSLLDTPSVVPWVSDAGSAALPGALQLWPHRHGTDAMFLALLRLS